MTWEPAPEGPPESASTRYKYHALYVWMNEHPGEWAVLRDINNGSLATRLRRKGYEVVGSKAENGHIDIYIRKPTPDQ